MTYLKRLMKDLNTSIGEKQANGTMRKKRVSTRALGTNPRAKGTNPRAKSNSQNDMNGANMEKKSFVVLELTDDEERKLNEEGEVSNMTKLEDKKMTEQLQESKQKRIWVDRFDEEDWKALFTKDLEEFFEYDKDYLRVF
jgi:hypothetical protein